MRLLLRLILLPLMMLPTGGSVAPVAPVEPVPVVVDRSAPAAMPARPDRVERPTLHAVVRLDPAALWKAPDVEAAPDASELLVPPGPWPEGATLDALWEGIQAESDDEGLTERLLDEAEAEGLLDAPASAFPDPWDRYAALWATYLQLDHWDDPEGWSELRAQVQASLEADPDHVTADALRVGLLMLTDDDDEGTLQLAWDLAHSPEPSWAAMGAEEVAKHEATLLEDLQALPQSHDPRVLRVQLRWALDHDHFVEAAQLAEAVLRSDPSAAAAREAQAASAWATQQPPWVERLAEELRACAGVEGWGHATIEVHQGRWTSEQANPIADCLHGWAPAGMPAEARIEVQTVP